MEKRAGLNSWQSKSVQECIDEGIYLYFAITFIGIFFEDEWFIIPNLAFYGDQLPESEIRDRAEANIMSDKAWEDRLFMPEEQSDLHLYVLPTSLEFKNAPWMVSIIKQEKKERINLAYCRYINEEFLQPFFAKLKIADYENFVNATPLRYGYTMIFPEHKKYSLFCAFVENKHAKWRLEYFLLNEGKFYKWTYFNNGAEYDFSFFYGNLIIADLQQISHWDQELYLDSSCTMDNNTFWNEYVFKKTNDGSAYVYLEQISIANP